MNSGRGSVSVAGEKVVFVVIDGYSCAHCYFLGQMAGDKSNGFVIISGLETADV